MKVSRWRLARAWVLCISAYTCSIKLFATFRDELCCGRSILVIFGPLQTDIDTRAWSASLERSSLMTRKAASVLFCIAFISDYDYDLRFPSQVAKAAIFIDIRIILNRSVTLLTHLMIISYSLKLVAILLAMNWWPCSSLSYIIRAFRARTNFVAYSHAFYEAGGIGLLYLII